MLVIEQATHFGREVIRAFDGVVTGEKELESHGRFLPLGLAHRPARFDLDLFSYRWPFELIFS